MSRLSKKLNLQVQDVHMGMFDYTVRIVYGDYANAQKYAAKVFGMTDEQFGFDDFETGDEPHGRTFCRVGFIPIIWVAHYPKTPREYATLAHEVIHAIAMMFRWIGIAQGVDTEEVHCHAVAHVINAVLEKEPKV